MFRPLTARFAKLFKAATKPTRPTTKAQFAAVEALEDRVTPALAYALSGTVLFTFDTATPGVITTVPITGVDAGETLAGLDARPATGQLYVLGVNATADTATVYTVDPTTAVATAVGTTGQIAFTTDGVTTVDLPDPTTVGYGFDFNPRVDLIRVVAGSLNFRVDPVAGAPVDGDAVTPGINPDGAISGATASLDAAAYTNVRANTGGPTSLYALNSSTGNLYLVTDPNGGTTSLIGSLGGTFSTMSGFDIPEGVNVTTSNTPVTTGTAFAVLNDGATTNLYSIDLTTGAATSLGSIFNGTLPVQGFTLAPAGTVAFQSATSTVPEAGGSAMITLTRTGAITGTTNATVTVTGGTATAGTDFTGGPYTVTFAPGATTATLTIPIVNDTLPEGDETAVFMITAADGGAMVGTPATNTLTIVDDDTAVQFQSATATVAEGGGTATITLTRTGAVTGTTNATVLVFSGTATAGADFTGGSYTVTFNPGATTATLTIPIVDDTLVEGNETAMLTITGADGGAMVGTPANNTLTITDNDSAPAPTVAITNATTVSGFMVLTGQTFIVLPLLPNTQLIFADYTGDGVKDVLLLTPQGFFLLDGFTSRVVAASADLNRDGFTDLFLFSPTTGALQRVVLGGTGQVITNS